MAVSSVSATRTGTHDAMDSSALTTNHNALARNSAIAARPASGARFTRNHGAAVPNIHLAANSWSKSRRLPGEFQLSSPIHFLWMVPSRAITNDSG